MKPSVESVNFIKNILYDDCGQTKINITYTIEPKTQNCKHKKNECMKYGLNMLLFTDDCTGEKYLPICEEIKKNGYDGIEIPLFNLDFKALGVLGKKLDEMALERTAVTVRSLEYNPISSDAAVRGAADENAKKILDACAITGVKILCGPLYAALGSFSGKPPTLDEWKWGVEGMINMAEYAKTVDVLLAIEPLNRFEIYLLNCAADGMRFLNEVNHPNCQYLFDTFHAHIEEKNSADAIRVCKEKLAHVHICANDRSTPGNDQINWNGVWGGLDEAGYDGWLVVEAFGMALPHLAAATKIWRSMFDSEEKLLKESLLFMKKNCQ